MISRAVIGVAGGVGAILLLVAGLAGPKWVMDHWANLKAKEKTSVIETGVTISAQEELDKYLRSHDQNTQKKERGTAAVRDAAKPRPTDDPDGKEAAFRRYDAWRASIISLCPDCEAGLVEDQPIN